MSFFKPAEPKHPRDWSKKQDDDALARIARRRRIGMSAKKQARPVKVVRKPVNPVRKPTKPVRKPTKPVRKPVRPPRRSPVSVQRTPTPPRVVRTSSGTRPSFDNIQFVNALGEPGKEGTTYLIRADDGREYAFKTYRKTKSLQALQKEAQFQRRAAAIGVSPKVYFAGMKAGYKGIIMDKMAGLLKDMYTRGDTLSQDHRDQITNLMERLDSISILHNDGNALNLMLDDSGRVQLIDYGLSSESKGKSNLDYTLWSLKRSFRHYGIAWE